LRSQQGYLKIASIIGSGINGNFVPHTLFPWESSAIASIIGSGINGNPGGRATDFLREEVSLLLLEVELMETD